ncbi:uncharacterized protein LOC128993923 [Macrosteles quadrilineatus]|uniref:uncharacterized protein LOC128993923 n=1 Tax=Macrosteles quadrilineatus TaxID=74068 RepID=UPI0023E2F43D|nr:uncharacterized protein LOC128993923 [Macrosteles quadrilineatus]
MVVLSQWLWLTVGWLTWTVPGLDASLCDSGSQCNCNLGKLTCDCSTSFLKEVVLKKTSLDPTLSSISIANCLHVHVQPNALSHLPSLQQVSVANVKQVTLEENAFSWTTSTPQQHHTGLVINITNCNINRVPSYSFKGFLRDILLKSLNISHINSYAFSSIDRAERIEFRNVNILEISTQSFKQISVEFLSLLDTTLNILPERTMTEVTVRQEVRLESLNISRLESSALKINSPRNFRLTNSRIGYVESNAFEVGTKGDVSIHENVFSHLESLALAGFHVEENYLEEAGKQDFVFENNTLIEFENECLKLNTSGFDPRLDWIMLKQKCSCDSAILWVNTLVVYPNMRLPIDKLLYCLNPTATRLSDFRRLYCNVARFSVFAVVVGVVVVVGIVSVILLVVYCGIRKRGKKYINVPTNNSALRAPEDNKRHMLVVPDGKTYRETELHVIFEHAEAIKTTNFVKGPDEPNG